MQGSFREMLSIRHLMSGAVWTAVGKLGQFVVGLGTVAILARLVGPEAFGVTALAWVAIGLIEIIVGNTLAESLVQRETLRPAHIDTMFWMSLALAALGVLFVSIASAPMATWLGDGDGNLAAVLVVRVLSVPLSAAGSIPLALLRRDGRFKTIAVQDTVATLGSSLLGVAMALAGFGIWSLVGMEMARVALVTVCAFVSARWCPGLNVERRAFDELRNFNAGTFAGVCIYYVDQMVPRAIIGHFLGSYAVGLYAIGERLVRQVGDVLIGPVWDVTMVGVSRAQSDNEKLRNILRTAILACSLIIAPLYLGLIAVAPVLVDMVFGPRWSDSIVTVQLLLLCGALTPITELSIAVLRGIGKSLSPTIMIALDAIVSAVLAMSVAGWGLEAIVAALVVKELLLLPTSAWIMRRSVGMKAGELFVAGFSPWIASVPMAFAAWGLQHWLSRSESPFLIILVAIFLGVSVYLLLLRILTPKLFGTALKVVRDFRYSAS